MTSGPWSDDEIENTIDVYFQMLTLELAGERYVKANYRDDLNTRVDRSRKAINLKFSNVSAVLHEIGALWIPGYKPMPNVQGLLRERVTERFRADTELRAFMLRAVEERADESAGSATVAVTIGAEAAPPAADWSSSRRVRAGRVDVDYASIEASNRQLGLAGELSVLAAERGRLMSAGRSDLASRVRHVSALDGDGLGYDISSYDETTAAPIHLEVKTTRYDREIPFYLSRNEVDASIDLGDTYRLVRLFRYGRSESGFYTLPGPLTTSADLKPDTYRALPAAPAGRAEREGA